MIFVYIALILLQVGVIIFFVRRGQLVAKQRDKAAVETTDGSYDGLRKLALHVTPDQLKLVIPADETLVYGVVMDWHAGEVVTTLAAYITGATSLCFSTGGVITGGGMNPLAGEAAVELVTAAQAYVERALPVSTTDVPPGESVRFYFLTNKGTLAAQEHTRHFEDNSSPWLLLFAKASMVINEIRGRESLNQQLS